MRGTRRRLAKANVAACVGRLVLMSMLAAPPSLAALHTGECRKLTRQIDHFKDVAEMAAGRRDQLWLESTIAQVERLSTRRVRLCPEYAKPNYAAIYAKWAGEMLKKAGRAFITFMTFGVY